MNTLLLVCAFVLCVFFSSPVEGMKLAQHPHAPVEIMPAKLGDTRQILLDFFKSTNGERSFYFLRILIFQHR